MIEQTSGAERSGIIRQIAPELIKDDKAFDDYLLLSGTAHMARYNAAIFEKAGQIDTALDYLIQADSFQTKADALRQIALREARIIPERSVRHA